MSHSIYLMSTLILGLLTHLRLDLSIGFSLHVFPSKFCRLCIPRVLYACCMALLANSPWADHPNYIWWRAQIVKIIFQFLCLSDSSPFSGPDFLHSTHFSNIFNLCSFTLRDQVSHTCKKQDKLGQISALYKPNFNACIYFYSEMIAPYDML